MKKNYFLSLFFFILSFSGSAKVYYVNATALGNNNGLSWANAFTDLQNALSISVEGDEIWVAKGTYYATKSNNRDTSFLIRNGVNLYGGFFGNEVSISERNIINNVSILSGDIGIKNDNTDNTKTIVKFENINDAVTFDAFRIEHGNNMAQDNLNGGTGISFLNNNAAINLTNVSVNNCRGYIKSGVYIFNSKVTAYNCTFSMNFSVGLAGAMYADSNSELNIIDSKFEQNSANLGAALDFQGKNLKMDRCSIYRNTCFSGNIINVGDSVENFTLSNSLIVGNLALSASVLSSSNTKQNAVKIINTTIVDNNSSGSIASTIFKNSNANSITIYNCIISDNGNNIEVNSGNLVYNSIVKNGYSSGINIIDSSPFFVNPAASNLAPFDAFLYNYSLKSNSPAINKGNNIYVIAYGKDFSGNDRIIDNIVDLGAIEFKEILANNETKVEKDFIYNSSKKSIVLLDEKLINKSLNIFDVQGRNIIANKLTSKVVVLNLNKGLYFAKIENKVIKIIVN